MPEVLIVPAAAVTVRLSLHCGMHAHDTALANINNKDIAGLLHLFRSLAR